MSETLYRKYRPKNFSEIIGQTHIVRTLSNSIKNNRIGHAYLFTGPRGTGKTSIARIMAKTVNCENLKDAITCEKCNACKLINTGKTLDIIEIDAASNTGVDNIRELRETVALQPTSLKYKIYIIDEVHMLSTGAFNALLKTLEEPPSHVIFILATTEIHKVPETIISRCQRFDFTRLPIQNIIEKLSLIAKEEKVRIDKNSLEMIAIAAEGGMRDAESLLGQIISLEDKNITSAEVEEILGTADRKFAYELADLIIGNKSSEAISKINSLLESGYDLEVFNKSFINYLRQLMLLKIDENLKSYFTYEITAEQMEKMIAQTKNTELSKIVTAINLFLEAQGKISSFLIPQLPLEIAIIKATQTLPNSVESSKYKVASIKPEGIPNEKSKAEPKIEKKENNNNSTIEQFSSNKTEENQKNTASIDISTARGKWNKLLVDIQPFNHSLKALLSTCQIKSVSGNKITLATPYDFYKERLEEVANKLTIEQVFSKILECPVLISITIDKTIARKTEENSPKAPEKESEQSSLLDSALEIMGGKIVKE